MSNEYPIIHAVSFFEGVSDTVGDIHTIGGQASAVIYDRAFTQKLESFTLADVVPLQPYQDLFGPLPSQNVLDHLPKHIQKAAAHRVAGRFLDRKIPELPADERARAIEFGVGLYDGVKEAMQCAGPFIEGINVMDLIYATIFPIYGMNFPDSGLNEHKWFDELKKLYKEEIGAMLTDLKEATAYPVDDVCKVQNPENWTNVCPYDPKNSV
jgi:hypothetical protein